MEKGMDKGTQQLISSIFSRKETNVSTPAAKNLLLDRSQTYEWTSWMKHEDKKSGSYKRYTTKEKASKGDLHVEKGTGQVGVKDEFKRSSTIRVGNKTGYTEYYTEHRVRDVNYGKSTASTPNMIRTLTMVMATMTVMIMMTVMMMKVMMMITTIRV
ncbi:hypothetical protein ACSBR1_001628 [Camellia fascicularis]